MALKSTSLLWPFATVLLLCPAIGADQPAGDPDTRDHPPPSDALSKASENVEKPGPATPGKTKPKEVPATDALKSPVKETGLPRSVLVKRDHTIVRIKPTQKARRRGVVMKGARLPVKASSTGFGCRGPWYQVHGDGWICGQEVVLSTLAADAPEYPIVPEGQLTPWPYGFVREDTLEYRVSDGALEEVREVFKGFGFGIKSRFRIDADKFFRTAEDTLIPRGAAGVTDRISPFRGMVLEAGKPWPIGFVHSRRAYAYGEPSRAEKHRLARVERYRPFEVLEVVGKRRFVRFDEGAYLAGADVRVATTAVPPKGVEPGERWIDVDTARQIMTAYEGNTPVYVTLVSTGRYGGSRTVKGTYRIWAKVSAIAMDNTDEELEDEAAVEAAAAIAPDTDAPGETAVAPERKLYSLHDVPWTQFFHESYALHGVYWHDSFGNRRSHGCVNLSPRDARWFYRWTAPSVPDGWWAIHATEADPGTLVRVR